MLLRVGSSGEADYGTLAQALAAADAGAVIELEAGEYAESLTLTFPVTIRALREEQSCFANAQIAAYSGHLYAHVVWKGAKASLVNVQGGDVTLQGMELQGSPAAALCEVNSGTLRLVDCCVNPGMQRKPGKGIVVGETASKGKAKLPVGEASVQLVRSQLVGRFVGAAIELGPFASAKLEQVRFVGMERVCLLLGEGASAELLEVNFAEVAQGIVASGKNALSLKLCRFEKFSQNAIELKRESTAKLLGCDFVQGEASAIVASGGGRVMAERCEFEQLAAPAIVLVGTKRSVLKRLRADCCGAALLVLKERATANLQDSVLAERESWQLEADTHLLLEGNRGGAAVGLAGDAATMRGECPFCYERVSAAAEGKKGAAILCPACGWSFATDKKGKLTSHFPLEIRCQGELCEQVFPAVEAGSDYCPDCLTLCHWDEAGYPTLTDCPECDGKIPLPKWKEGELSAWCQCKSCEGKVRVDRQGMILEFGGEWE